MYCAQSLVLFKVYFFFPAWFCIFGLPWIEHEDAAWHAAGVRAHQHVASDQGGDKFTRHNRECTCNEVPKSRFFTRVSEAQKLDKLGVNSCRWFFWLCGRWFTCWIVPSSLEFVVHRNLQNESSLEMCDLIRPFALAAPLSSSTGDKGWEVSRTHCYSYKLSPVVCRFFRVFFVFSHVFPTIWKMENWPSRRCCWPEICITPLWPSDRSETRSRYNDMILYNIICIGYV